MDKIKILLAEDEPFLAKIVKESLEAKNYEVSLASDGVKAYSAFRTFAPDVCILDVMMPGKDGFRLAEDIRQTDPQIPIIFLTARSQTEDVVKGFELGGNDYLKKPFSMEELLVRIKAQLSRFTTERKETLQEQFEIGLFHFNNSSQELMVQGRAVKLSFRESALLKLLVENKNQVLNRKTALDYLWGDDSFFNARSMDVFITKLRKHLKPDDRIEIVNIRGIGYKLIINE